MIDYKLKEFNAPVRQELKGGSRNLIFEARWDWEVLLQKVQAFDGSNPILLRYTTPRNAKNNRNSRIDRSKFLA